MAIIAESFLTTNLNLNFMLSMPSTLSLLGSTLSFFIAAWYVRAYLIKQDIEKGFTLNIVVLTMASLISFGTGEILGWIDHKTVKQNPALQAPVTVPEEAQSAVKEPD